MKIKFHHRVIALVLPLAFTFQISSVLAQGSLTPPGAPAPTMRTLLQIEPRTPISSLPYSISSSGAYYLTTNLTGTSGSDGIDILASNVDLDLNGFTMTGVAGSQYGIFVAFGPDSGLTIRNGTVTGWGFYGIFVTNSISASLQRIRANGNTSGGISIGPYSVAEDCAASGNGGVGITAGIGCRITDCTVTANGTSGLSANATAVVSGCIAMSNLLNGILVGNAGTVSGCSATQNAANGGAGIATGTGSTVIGCTADFNVNGSLTSPGISVGNNSTVKNCTALSNGAGIAAGNGCNIMDSTACNSLSGSGEGITVGSYCVVRGCLTTGNSFNGIVLSGSNTVIMDNICTASGSLPDIYISGSHNTVIRNIVDTNAANSSIVGIGVLTGSFNAIGTTDTSTTVNTDKNPQANFQP
jgi:hypothetical protein